MPVLVVMRGGDGGCETVRSDATTLHSLAQGTSTIAASVLLGLSPKLTLLPMLPPAAAPNGDKGGGGVGCLC